MGVCGLCRVEFRAHDVRIGHHGLHGAGGCRIGHTGSEGLSEWRGCAGYILAEDSGCKGEIVGLLICCFLPVKCFFSLNQPIPKNKIFISMIEFSLSSTLFAIQL